VFEHFGNITFPSKQLLLAQIKSNRMDQKWKMGEMMIKLEMGDQDQTLTLTCTHSSQLSTPGPHWQ
jgi:hypothetical protein